jgi:Zn-dependent protease
VFERGGLVRLALVAELGSGGVSMDSADLLERVMFVIPLVLSLTVHEWAHAYSAFRLGDDTAARMGRLTLNPIPHIDPIGTLLLPMLGVPFGWAKPVPVNPTRFDRKVNMTTGMMITASAGPLSNVVLAIGCVLTFGVLLRLAPGFVGSEQSVSTLLMRGFQINVALAVFNMLPVPPLDGSRVADGLMPRRLRPAWEKFASFGPLALLAVLFLPSMFNFSLLQWPLTKAWELAYAVLNVIVQF